MPSSLTQRVSRAFSISSRSQRRNSVQTLQSVQSICSDRDGLLSVEFPSSQCPSRMEVMMEESDELDLEDQAWGSPPSTNFLPRFLRRRT